MTALPAPAAADRVPHISLVFREMWDTTALDVQLYRLSLVRSVPGFPTSPLSPATTYVVLPKENHMQLIEAATLDRKSGGADLSRLPRRAVGRAVEGSEVPRTTRHKRKNCIIDRQ
jgi:hypothetical protein